MEINSVAESSNHLAAEIIASNEDVISEILLRLPVKSLIRFKLVSKDWRSFISKPHFAHRHTQISLRRYPDFLSPRGLFFYSPGIKDVEYITCIQSSESKKTDKFHFPSLSFLKSALGSRVKVLHSCNGLSLCRFTSKYGLINYCIYNLTTQEFSRVPQPPDDRPGSTFAAFALVFNPLESPYCKIVGLREFHQPHDRKRSSHSTDILVYSSENGTWKSKWFFQGFYKFEYFTTPSAYWNGRFYWIRNTVCYRLDLNAEDIKLKKIASPSNQEDYWTDFKDRGNYALYFGEWCGHLHAVSIRRDSKQEFFQVMEYDEFSSEWFVKYTVNIASIISGFPQASKNFGHDDTTHYAIAILAIIRGDREEDSALVLVICGKIISYRFMSETVEMIRKMPGSMRFDSNFYSFSHTTNLSPVRVN